MTTQTHVLVLGVPEAVLPTDPRLPSGAGPPTDEGRVTFYPGTEVVTGGNAHPLNDGSDATYITLARGFYQEVGLVPFEPQPFPVEYVTAISGVVRYQLTGTANGLGGTTPQQFEITTEVTGSSPPEAEVFLGSRGTDDFALRPLGDWPAYYPPTDGAFLPNSAPGEPVAYASPQYFAAVLTQADSYLYLGGLGPFNGYTTPPGVAYKIVEVTITITAEVPDVAVAVAFTPTRLYPRDDGYGMSAGPRIFGGIF